MNKRLFALLLTFGMLIGTRAEAARAPELFVNAATGSAVAQVNVIDADANAPVTLFYQANGATHSAEIGTTNASGNLSTTVNAATYGIAVGTQAHVVAHGASSPSVPWPDYASGGSLPLSAASITLLPGQSGTVTASVSANLTIGSNSVPSVASATISGQQISVRALASGADNISICAAGLGCSTIAVTVTTSSGSNTSPAAFSLSTDTGNGSQMTLGLGQTLVVPLLGNASHMFSISSNSSPTVVGASANGASLYLSGLEYGGSNIQVCEFEGQCASIYVYIASPKAPTSTAVSTPAQKPAVSATTPASAPRAVFTTYLKPGSSGAEVRSLQAVLIKLGFLKHVATGYYGDHTVDAVAALQKKHNLAALGVVGPATRALLNSLPQ